MDKAPVITPIKIKEYEVKQSKYHQCGKLPVRSVLLGPSHSGKGVLLQNMILDIYKNCFERIHIYIYISKCPAGHHCPWAWDVGMSGYLVVWLDGWLAVKSTKIDVENS